MMNQLNDYFESMVEIPRIKASKRQTIETLINEEVLLLARDLRDENNTWSPRITRSAKCVPSKDYGNGHYCPRKEEWQHCKDK